MDGPFSFIDIYIVRVKTSEEPVGNDSCDEGIDKEVFTVHFQSIGTLCSDSLNQLHVLG